MVLSIKCAGPGKINVKEAADMLDAGGEIFEFYYDRDTGAIVEVPTEEALYDFDPEDIPDSDRELWASVEDDEEGKRFLKLPTQFEINEFDIMRDFVESLTDETKKSVLSEQMRAGAALNHFKNKVIRLGLDNRWLEFKAGALTKMVYDWCAEHKIEGVVLDD
jgi:hypothetical protein